MGLATGDGGVGGWVGGGGGWGVSLLGVKSWSHRSVPLRAAQELCESRVGGPLLPVPNSPYELCGCKAVFENGSHRCSY